MNIKEIIVLDEVSEDIEDGSKFYDRCEFGIGDYFIDCIISDIESLKLYAGIHSKHFGSFRIFSKRFPFAIYYDLYNNIAIVIALLDMRMNPAWIRKKLKNRRV